MMPWPSELNAVFESPVTCEFATLTRAGLPITSPLLPFVGAGGTLDVSTGLAYPAKAERARRNPKVALLFSDATGARQRRPPVVLVQGLATVRDADVQANTDRYLRLVMEKFPEPYRATPRFLLRQMNWYFARIWIEVTPLEIQWWPAGRTTAPPERWEAPPETAAPASDPPPTGPAPGAWKDAPLEWRRGAAHAIQALGLPVLTVVGADGFPVLCRAQRAALNAAGFQLTLPQSLPAPGPACLTFHTHAPGMTWQENMEFVGRVEPSAEGVQFHVERRLGDWSLPGSRWSALWSMLRNGQAVKPRLASEARRRGQPVPQVRLS